ncbi:PIN domain-containing protein [Streptomyces sp. INA 01156]
MGLSRRPDFHERRGRTGSPLPGSELPAPCKESKNQKTGSRDAAIWLSAVEYAQANPDETIYFVSANTKDFGDGTSFPYPMNEDIADMTDRFILLTSMDAVASHFTEPTETDEALVTEILRSKTVLSDLADTAELSFPYPFDPAFQCTVPLSDGSSVTTQAAGWQTLNAQLGSVEDIRTFRIGDREWCTASVEWHITGFVERALIGPAFGAVSWTTAVLFNLNRENPNLTVLREAPPRPASAEVVGAGALPSLDATTVERTLMAFEQATRVTADTAPTFGAAKRYGLPRAYERALVRQARLRMGETSPG